MLKLYFETSTLYLTLQFQINRGAEIIGGVDLTKCKLCNMSNLCDEYHVLFLCKFFVKERKRYLKKYFHHRPNALKLHALFNSNMKQLSQLTKFIKIILSHF